MNRGTLSDSGADPAGFAYEHVDDHEADTGVSDVVEEYVRLSLATGVPTLRGAIDWNDLSAREAWVVSLVAAGFTVQAILDTSPLAEEETMTVLGQLVDSRIIAVLS